MSTMSSGFTFKRAWDKVAQNVHPGVLVFGSLWGLRYSRNWDLRDWCGAEKLLRLDGDDNILDVGCGPLARAEVYFGRKEFKIVGVDISVTVASQAKRIIEEFRVQRNIDLVVADAEFLPFREESFDKILAAGLIVHLPAKENAIRTLQQFRFCMKKNGLCYISWLPNLYSIFGSAFKFITRIGFIRKTERIQLLVFKGLGEIQNLCGKAGLRVLGVFQNSIFWIGFYLLPAFTHKYIEKIVSVQNKANSRYPRKPSLPYSFNIITKKD